MEWLVAEYGLSFTEAVWKTPLVLAMVILPVRNERHGASGGPSFIVRASLRAKNRAYEFLKEHFEIVPKSPAETGWRLGANTYLKTL